MSHLSFFKTHRTWEDWLGMALGVLIVLSPWFPTQAPHEMVDAERSFIVLNTFTVGLLVFGLAQLEYVALQRWEEVAEILLGLWLIVSPYIFGYWEEGMLRLWHTTLGGLVVLLAGFQLWQDWDLNEQELARHGQ
ncbi:SPW repeat protein [Bradyrhizobium lablabi]|uniref:SPW repeat protein n=1 Tax=Bradyrhizobium lablabi TaxID=722472 RepID=UPI001BAE0DE9|nr:SPW repeat protein [Bradyrhizobium lablabi]MBR1120808.1 SPW repeat protein [Bradyrhizobium lablabi]